MESKIQNAIKRKLQKDGWLVLKIIQLSENGYPDLLCLKDGLQVWIEVKQKGKIPRPLQFFRMEQLNCMGIKAFWTYDPDDKRIQNMLSNT